MEKGPLKSVSFHFLININQISFQRSFRTLVKKILIPIQNNNDMTVKTNYCPYSSQSHVSAYNNIKYSYVFTNIRRPDHNYDHHELITCAFLL